MSVGYFERGGDICPLEQQDADLRALYPGLWFACWEPEQPINFLTAFHTCCPKCLLKAQITEVASGPLIHERGPLVDVLRGLIDEHGALTYRQES